MASTYMTPGVYIEEKNAFPNSAVAVETAVPVFIGYTETATINGKSLVGKPTKITSFAEYLQSFGPDSTKPYVPKYSIGTAAPTTAGFEEGEDNTITLGGIKYYVTSDSPFYMFNSIRLFYANGGSACYIMSVGVYGPTATTPVSEPLQKDLTPFEPLTKEFEPTLVVIPDAVHLGKDAYNTVYTAALEHCAAMQSRFAILDVAQQGATDTTDGVILEFRNDIGINNLNYGAAYYPWLKTAIVTPDEVTLDNITVTGGADINTILPEPIVATMEAKLKTDQSTATAAIATAAAALKTAQGGTDAAAIATATKALADANAAPATLLKNFYQGLKANSPSYGMLLDKVRAAMNELPPSGAMAGLYTMVDNNRGVWKAPANVSVNMVNAPAVNVSHDMQQSLNVDVMAGKSINVIRSFPGIGTLVWGARTLDGNSQDWRYINVRRTLIMIEQSLKLAARAYVFEPNDANTWITVKSMMDNFLVNLWKQGALAGAVPEQAFSVSVGLGATMTGNDILDGKMLITVKVAIVRPAEFIVITFQQQMQES